MKWLKSYKKYESIEDFGILKLRGEFQEIVDKFNQYYKITGLTMERYRFDTKSSSVDGYESGEYIGFDIKVDYNNSLLFHVLLQLLYGDAKNSGGNYKPYSSFTIGTALRNAMHEYDIQCALGSDGSIGIRLYEHQLSMLPLKSDSDYIKDVSNLLEKFHAIIKAVMEDAKHYDLTAFGGYDSDNNPIKYNNTIHDIIGRYANKLLLGGNTDDFYRIYIEEISKLEIGYKIINTIKGFNNTGTWDKIQSLNILGVDSAGKMGEMGF